MCVGTEGGGAGEGGDGEEVGGDPVELEEIGSGGLGSPSIVGVFAFGLLVIRCRGTLRAGCGVLTRMLI